jgi:Stage II sporulation protein E (SpoIIE)
VDLKRAGNRGGGDRRGGGPLRTITRVVEVVPDLVKWSIGALGLLALVLGASSCLAGLRARRLARHRERLLHEVGLLQSALLPVVPERLGDLRTSAAYHPAEGVGAGGDFYDAFVCADGRIALLVRDVSGHGHEALAATTLIRYTLRAYVDGGLEPRRALKLVGRVLDESLEARSSRRRWSPSLSPTSARLPTSLPVTLPRS